MGVKTWPAALLGVGLLTGAAHAQVIEVGPAGAATISGPAVYTAEGRTPIAAPKRQQRAAPGTTALLAQAGQGADLSTRLLEAIAYVESRFNAAAVSPKGAVGMMQLMPATASALGVDASDPAQNARGGAAYMRRMLELFDNDIELALAAYNAGPEAVQRHKGIPPYAETRAYVAAVLDYLAETQE